MIRVKSLAFKLYLVAMLGVSLFLLLPAEQARAAVNAPADCSKTLFNRCFNTGYFTGTEGPTRSEDYSIIFPLTTDYVYADNPFFPNGAAINWSFPSVPGCRDSDQVPLGIGGCTFNAGYTETFINQMWSYINTDYECPQFPLNATDACGRKRVNAIGAAMIIDTMLGRHGTDYGNAQWGVNDCGAPDTFLGPDWYGYCYFPRVKAGITYARDNFNAWKNMVRNYNEAGLVHWSEFSVYAPGHDNSTGMNYGTDAEFFNNTDTTMGQFIRFMNPNDPSQELFTINRACGNIIGTATPWDNIPAATLAGVKIDDSRVDAVGSNIGYGGNCYSATQAVNCGNGSLSDFPFSDDCVAVGGSGSGIGTCSAATESNPYVYNSAVKSGIRMVAVQDAGVPDGGEFAVFGYSICEDGAGCTSAYLTSTANIKAGNSFAHYFAPGKTYHMRWIFAKTSCGNLMLSQNPVERGAPFNVTASFTASVTSSSLPVSYSITLNMSGPGAVMIPPPATKGPFTLAPGSTSGGSATWNGVILGAVGTYSGTYVVSGGINLTCPFGTGAPDVPPPVVAVAKPYFSLVNGDIATGMGTCPGWGIGTGGTLTSWNNGGLGAGNLGSGSNLAAYAMGLIEGFASAQSTSGSTAPKSLSFANTVGAFGGSFGNTIPCPADYYGMLDTGSATPITSSSSVPNTNEVYYATGNFKLNNGAVTAGNRPIIYVNGDVFIEDKITTSSGATLSSLSNFYLVVKGDIYISPDVARLDGVYVAQPRSDGTGGRIYTCSRNGAYQPPLASQLNGVSGGGLSSCMSQLTVNGAFIAKELKLYRSIGSMSTGTPAEVFNYTPATWLAVPESIINRTSGSGYHSITSLPPIL